MTDYQRVVLAHVVVNPDEWYAHAVKNFGQKLADEYLAAKVARWKPEYERECVKAGYKTRAQREADSPLEKLIRSI